MKKGRLMIPQGAIKVSPPVLSPGIAAFQTASRQGLLQMPAHFRARPAQQSLILSGSHQIPDGSIYVDAPDLAQPTNYSCAMAAASIARMYGVGPDSMDEFREGMKTKRSGTSPANITRYMNKLGLDARIKRKLSKEDLMDLLDDEIASVLDIQAWASDPRDYDDPANNNNNGHYVTLIGYSAEAPVVVSTAANTGSTEALGRSSALAARTMPASKGRPGRSLKPKGDELYFYFMDPSLLCRYGYLPWAELDRRWHDDEGTRKKPRPNWHMGIVIRPNGHKAIHDTVAEFIG